MAFARLIAVAASGLFLAGCGAKDHPATATTTTVSVAPGAGAGAGNIRPAPESSTLARNALPPPADDRAQTAAVSPPANSNGTLPASPGVGPAGGSGAAAATGVPR
jgi:hypothetical protein